MVGVLWVVVDGQWFWDLLLDVYLLCVMGIVGWVLVLIECVCCVMFGLYWVFYIVIGGSVCVYCCLVGLIILLLGVVDLMFVLYDGDWEVVEVVL